MKEIDFKVSNNIFDFLNDSLRFSMDFDLINQKIKNFKL